MKTLDLEISSLPRMDMCEFLLKIIIKGLYISRKLLFNGNLNVQRFSKNVKWASESKFCIPKLVSVVH